MIEKIGGRKFLFAILAVLMCFVLVLTGYTTADKWLQFVEIIGGSYILGNVASKFAPTNTSL